MLSGGVFRGGACSGGRSLSHTHTHTHLIVVLQSRTTGKEKVMSGKTAGRKNSWECAIVGANNDSDPVTDTKAT